MYLINIYHAFNIILPDLVKYLQIFGKTLQKFNLKTDPVVY